MKQIPQPKTSLDFYRQNNKMKHIKGCVGGNECSKLCFTIQNDVPDWSDVSDDSDDEGFSLNNDSTHNLTRIVKLV